LPTADLDQRFAQAGDAEDDDDKTVELSNIGLILQNEGRKSGAISKGSLPSMPLAGEEKLRKIGTRAHKYEVPPGEELVPLGAGRPPEPDSDEDKAY